MCDVPRFARLALSSLVLPLLTASTLAAGDAKPRQPKNLKAKDITELKVLLDGRADVTRLLPATPVHVDIVVKDKKAVVDPHGRQHARHQGTAHQRRRERFL